MERASFVAVYRDTGAEPEYLQTLPSGIGPEGLLAIPSRNLFVTANEADLVEDGGARATVMIYERGDGAPRLSDHPGGADASRSAGARFPASPPTRATPGRLYAVTDSAYSRGADPDDRRDRRSRPRSSAPSPSPRTARRCRSSTSKASPRAPDGGFWLASEGDPEGGDAEPPDPRHAPKARSRR